MTSQRFSAPPPLFFLRNNNINNNLLFTFLLQSTSIGGSDRNEAGRRWAPLEVEVVAPAVGEHQILDAAVVQVNGAELDGVGRPRLQRQRLVFPGEGHRLVNSVAL